MKKNEMINKLTRSVISMQTALINLEEVKHTGYYSQKLKQSMNGTLRLMIERESIFDELFNHATDEAENISNIHFELLKSVADLPIEFTGEVLGLITAYKQNRAVMLQAAQKELNVKLL